MLWAFVRWSVDLQQTLTGFLCAFLSPVFEWFDFFNPSEAKKEPLLLSIEYLDNGGLMGVESGGQSVTMESFSWEIQNRDCKEASKVFILWLWSLYNIMWLFILYLVVSERKFSFFFLVSYLVFFFWTLIVAELLFLVNCFLRDLVV